jgi:hypothetical protein
MPGLIQRGDGVSFSSENRVVSSTTYDIYDDEGYVIGYIVEVSEGQNRPVSRLRHLNSSDAGRVIGMVPSPADFTLNVNGYSLYGKSQTNQKSLIHRLGSTAAALKSIQSQIAGFNFVATETHPSTDEQNKTWYYDCWMTSFSKGRSINQVVQLDRATIAVGQMETR